jgi:hypothetical protein
MLIGHLALVTAALFSGAAVYVSLAEQPARLTLYDPALLAQWKASYAHAAPMQAGLAVVGFALGLLAWRATGETRWLQGAAVLIAAWPYTLIGIMPTNRRLKAIDPAQAGPETRALIRKWGRLHAVRAALGLGATALFLWASVR